MCVCVFARARACVCVHTYGNDYAGACGSNTKVSAGGGGLVFKVVLAVLVVGHGCGCVGEGDVEPLLHMLYLCRWILTSL